MNEMDIKFGNGSCDICVCNVLYGYVERIEQDSKEEELFGIYFRDSA